MLEKGESVSQAIDRICFADGAPLRLEYAELYSSLFGESVQYDKIVRALSSVKCGMTKNELLKLSGIESGGNANRYVESLEQSGFIRMFTSFGKKKRDAIYQLVDNFTLFHLKFIDGESNPDAHFWQHATIGSSLNAWRGIAFERVCLQHVDQIKMALGISGVLTKVYSWHHVPDEVYTTGVQIDLLIERADRVVNVCEVKFNKNPFVIDKNYDHALREKIGTFADVTKTKDAVQLTMITSGGLSHSGYWGIVQSEVSLTDLFVEIEH